MLICVVCEGQWNPKHMNFHDLSDTCFGYVIGLNTPVGLLKEWGVNAQIMSASLLTQCFRSATALA